MTCLNVNTIKILNVEHLQNKLDIFSKFFYNSIISVIINGFNFTLTRKVFLMNLSQIVTFFLIAIATFSEGLKVAGKVDDAHYNTALLVIIAAITVFFMSAYLIFFRED